MSCITPCGCRENKDGVTRCCLPICYYELSKDDKGCAQIFISPCYCQKKVTHTIALEGETKSKEVNEYIKANKIRTRDDKYIYCTFGRFFNEEGPVRQSMTNEEVERIVKNNIVKNHIQSLEMGDGKNISSLIGDFI